MIAGVPLKKGDPICYHHLNIFTEVYTNKVIVNKACFDPFRAHTKLIKNKKSLTVVSTQLKQEMSDIHINSHVGLKLCKSCVVNVRKTEPTAESDSFTPLNDRELLEDNISSLNESVSSLTIPIKLDHVMKLSVGRRAYFIDAKAKEINENFTEIMGQAISVQQSGKPVDHHSLLMNEVKAGICTSTRSEQIRLLTLLPVSWPREQVAAEYVVSERQIKEVRELKRSKDVFSEVPRADKGNKSISEEVRASVIKFYTESEFVRPMPGAKNVVSRRLEDSTKTYEAQRVIICNLA